MFVSFLIGFLLALMLSNVPVVGGEAHANISWNPWFTPGKCRGMWRHDRLTGQCFGLEEHTKFEELKGVSKVMSADQCRALCCNLGDKCITWQYRDEETLCKLGGAVRLGNEGADTPLWCDPFPAGRWYGKRLVAREGGKCVWGKAEPFQCFGLGVERMHGGNNSRIETWEECEARCCADTHDDPELSCGIYQQNSRGCYFGSTTGVYCNEKLKSKVEGHRKCVPGFCGGDEAEKAFMAEFHRQHKAPP